MFGSKGPKERQVSRSRPRAAVEETNAFMREMSASAQELTQIAGELQGKVQRFRTADGGASPPGKVPPVTRPRVVNLARRQPAAA